MEDFLRRKNLSELKEIRTLFNINSGSTKEKIIQKLLPALLLKTNYKIIEQHFPPSILHSLKDILARLPSCCKNILALPAELECSNCKETQHRQCVNQNSKINPYICPSCILEKISPFEPVCETLVKAFKLMPNKISGRNYEIKELNFEISDKKINEIFNGDEAFQVQARCIKMDGTSIHQVWPEKGFLIVNQKVAMRFVTSMNPNSRKRKDQPLNLTTLMKSGMNTIAMVVFDYQNIYYMNLVVVRKKTETQLIN